MADTYITLPIETDPEDVLNDAYEMMQTLIPGWQPANGNLDVWLLQAIASIASESRDVASEVSKSIFRWFGANLVGIPPIDATSAYGNTTWTMVDNLGHTIPAGTQVTMADTTGTDYAFETQQDIIVYAGSTATAAGAVQIVAADVEYGASANGLTNPVDLLDPLAFITSITITAPTVGGQDAESDDDYLDRLAATFELLAPRPILPNDFAVLAREIPGAWRATAIDLYSPGPPITTNVPRCVTVIAIDQSGNAVSSSVKTAIDNDLQARREVNFLVYEADATQVLINVTYTAIALVGFDKPTLVSSINSALQNYLNPATWGSAEDDPRAWRLVTTVRYLEIAQVINEVQGVDYISALTIGIQGSAMGTVDLNMTGTAPLPKANTLTGTVN